MKPIIYNIRLKVGSIIESFRITKFIYPEYYGVCSFENTIETDSSVIDFKSKYSKIFYIYFTGNLLELDNELFLDIKIEVIPRKDVAIDSSFYITEVNTETLFNDITSLNDNLILTINEQCNVHLEN